MVLEMNSRFLVLKNATFTSPGNQDLSSGPPLSRFNAEQPHGVIGSTVDVINLTLLPITNTNVG